MAKGSKNSLLNKDGTLNKANYDKKVRKQQETFSQIDSAMSILEKLPDMADTALGLLDTRSISLSMSPMGFLFNILRQLGVSEETLREWIVEILIYALPAVEIGLKASLLTNLKSLVSCNSDARIPWWLRKDPKSVVGIFRDITSFDSNNERGMIINIDAIDPEGMLDLSPFTQPGMTKYFGCVADSMLDTSIKKVLLENDLDDGTISGGVLDEVVPTASTSAQMAKLARADDFNAFLWYVIHKGNKQNPIGIKLDSNGIIDSGGVLNNGKYRITNDSGVAKNNIRGVSRLYFDPNEEGDTSNATAGTTFYDVGNPSTIAIVLKTKVKSNGDEDYKIVVEVSSDWYSCNWYVDKSNYYGANTGLKKKAERDYASEKGICNLRYSVETDFRGRKTLGSPDNLIFTILPKPAILLPSIGVTQGKVAVQSRIVRLLFDADGTPNQKGKYSLYSEGISKSSTKIEGGGTDSVKMVTINGVSVNINTKTGKYSLVNQSDASKLIECYPGLTVYEFNYDFVMGMKLFDPKVVCQRVLENAFNPKYNANFYLSFNKTKDKNVYPFLGGKQRLIEVVKEILEEDEDEINDCFYSFSNEQYEEMLDETEKIRYSKSPYDNGYDETSGIDMSAINDILNEYPENGTLEEQKDVINRALIAATGLISDTEHGTSGVDGITTNSKSSSIKVDFLTNILESLVMAVVDALLSPKVLLLLAINKQLMSNDDDGPISTKALMSLMKNLLKSLVREVRDLIMQKILDYILKTLMPIALQIQAKIASEQFQAYLMIIKLLLSWFNKGLAVVTSLSSILSSLYSKFKKRFGSGGDYSTFGTDIDLPSVLDDITYADIYPDDVPEKTPIIENC